MGWPESWSFIVPPHSENFGLGGKLHPEQYLGRLAAHCSAAEGAGVTGAFVYDFPVALDPWLAAFDVLVSSSRLQPIVAVRPHEEGAQAVARRVVDLQYRFGRPTHVNVVAGATRPSRSALDLADKVAARRELAEFAAAFMADVRPRLEPEHERPLVYTPASSTPGAVPADCILMMAKPREILASEIARVREEQGVGRFVMLVGLVVRETDEDAWDAAGTLYAPDRRQEIAGRLFMSQVVSSEHTATYALAKENDVHDERLWFGAPMRGIDAPKLVGSFRASRDYLLSCRDLGVTDLIVDLVPDPREYDHIGRLVELLR